LSEIDACNAPELPSGRDLKHGLWVAIGLSLAFLAITIYQTAATLSSRLAKSDVMEAAIEGAVTGAIAFEVIWFVAAVLALHIGLGVVAWLLACASAVNWKRVREKFGRYVIGWFALLAAGTVAYSALWHPRTLLGAYYHEYMASSVAGISFGRILYFGVIAISALVVMAASWKVTRTPRVTVGWRVAAIGVPVAAASITFFAMTTGPSAAASPLVTTRPNVIIIGIDSLRLEHVRRYGGHGLTPNLDAFIHEADLFKDATTPLARTFPSWISILTGRSPVSTGARFNLADRRRVQSYPTIGDILRASGYYTVFAMDEVRFANIDESYGFDKIVSPRMGASDFLLGTYNELPLSSVVINTRLGKWLFPYSHGNRGAATMYLPRTYLERLDQEVQFDRPTLLIAHLTGAHWPYYTGETPFGIQVIDEAQSRRPLYEESLRVVDAMFGDVIAMLKRKGALENAVVVVLSDHGEALALPGDTIFQDGFTIEGLKAPFTLLHFGHGQSVLSDTQYHVMLGFQAFGATKVIETSGRDYGIPVSVEDIAPTVLDLIGLDAARLSPNGTSLAPLLRTGLAEAGDVVAADRVRFTETDLRVLPAKDGFDEDATAEENSKYFQIDPETGRMHIREYMAPLAIAYKERAAFTQQHLLAVLPAGPEAMQYMYFDLKSGNGRLLTGRPNSEDPAAQHLWDALIRHYGNEMKRPVVVTPQDGPAIDAAWANYLRSIERAQANRHTSAGIARPGDGTPES
jgi:arylsulfatase A-like enzyme